MKTLRGAFDILRHRKEEAAMQKNIINVSTAIDYIENHLAEKLDLESVAKAVHYSKYHLHRVFTDTVGLSLHDYINRRKLTEAAKLLVFSNQSILEIALIAGYESQQAFSKIFKLMYKRSPNQYREAGNFYPLQLRYILHDQPTKTSTKTDWKAEIQFAETSDIPAWMDFVRLVVDGFPHLNEADYLTQLKEYIQKQQALLIQDAGIMIGAMAFCRKTGSIDFLGIHPQYTKHEIAKHFLQWLFQEQLQDTPLSITTFRKGDKADTGYRKTWEKLGFAEAELLTEFGYPTQKFVLSKEALKGACHE